MKIIKQPLLWQDVHMGQWKASGLSPLQHLKAYHVAVLFLCHKYYRAVGDPLSSIAKRLSIVCIFSFNEGISEM